MADLNDLKNFANQVTPTIEDLVSQWVHDTEPADARDANDAIATLQNLLAQASQKTPRTPSQCADALGAVDEALTEILVQAASNSEVAIPATKVETIKEQLLSIKSTLGELATVDSLTPLAKLLPPQDIATISANLQSARDGIQQRQTAQAILDTVIDVVIIASQIAVKVATA
jgi:hypothetical protein